MKSNKLYVVTRQDLSTAQQAVQAGHAVAEFFTMQLKAKLPIKWYNETLIYLVAQDEEHLREISTQLVQTHLLQPIFFYEPDRNNELTAFACYYEAKGKSNVQEGRILMDLPLLSQS